MPLRDQLTTQGIRSLFKSNFDLAAYAIRLARFYIKSGREVTVDQLLEEIRKNPHQYDEATIKELEAIEEKE
jgi:outer membrane protein assembly factor BamD (BamD/ComL family)